MPTWDGLHPLVIHFPIALLIVAPLLVVLGLVLYRQSLWFNLSALLLMGIGTVAAFVAVSTGEAAAELALRTSQVETVLERHEELAETTAWVFLGATVLFAVITLAPHAVKRPLKRIPGTLVAIGFLVAYAGGVLLLANTAHQGGRLVHEFGVQALVSAAPDGAGAASYRTLDHDDDDDD